MPPELPRHRPWTMMVYMAGDNGKVFETQHGKIKLMAEMTGVGYRDLAEMAAVGTTDNVALTCLFDTQAASYWIEVRRGNGFEDSIVRPLSEVNTGDPAVLQRFIVESVRAYPADHYALVIWNHGSGWLDVDMYASVRAFADTQASHSPIFRSTPRQLAAGDMTRPIAFDDSSKDFLDTRGLRQALGNAEAATGARLDLIGMDACLMAMIEGARELAPYADYFVASQEVEPMAGWPYGPIVTALDRDPGLSPAALAETIVEEFARNYGGLTRGPETVTQSAVVLAHTATTETLCRELVDTILSQATPSLRRLVRRARDRTLVFQDRNYRDLGDFASRLMDELEWENYPAVWAAAVALRDHLEGRGNQAPVLKVGYLPAYERATGLSVYLPASLPARQREQTLAIYRQLLFAQRTGWDRLVDWLLESA